MTATSVASPSLMTLVWRSLSAFRALHLALALGIAAATAVMVGALLVGDSMRGSLKDIVVKRFGNVQAAMLSQRFFNPDMFQGATDFPDGQRASIWPAIVLPSSAVELKHSSGLQRASSVQVLGIEPEFWKVASDDASLQQVVLASDEVAINQPLARELNAKVGDEITIRLPKGSGVPADSPLGRRDDASGSLPRQRIAVILPDKSLADIDFRAGQQPTRNVFLPLSALQDALEQPDRANAGLVTWSEYKGGSRPLGPAADLPAHDAQRLCDNLNARISPKLSDYGLKLTRHTRRFPDTDIGESFPEETPDDQRTVATIFDYYQFTSDQLIIDGHSHAVLYDDLAKKGLEPQRAISYLANAISVVTAQNVESSTVATYSIVVGLDNWEGLLDNLSSERSGEHRLICAINSWLADRLGAKVNSTIRIKYYRPETVEGREIETSQDLTVSQIIPVTEPAKGYVRNRPAVFKDAPTVANDPNLTPVVPGITDQDSISKWDLPFPLTRSIPKEDDDYWRDYRLTPKVFLNYPQGIQFFGSRFGQSTAIRLKVQTVEDAGFDQQRLEAEAATALLHAKAGMGLQILPLRAMQLQAASGTTPFDGLFIALSFFVIVAALMLVALLFRLSIEQRASQWGLLMATGFTVGRVRSLLLRESLMVIGLGIGVGIVLGMGYAWLMIAGLQNWWTGAVNGSFLQFHLTLRSLLIGAGIGGCTSLLTILWCLRGLKRSTPLDLMRGRWETGQKSSFSANQAALAVAGFMLFGAIGLLVLGFTQSGMAQAGSFFGCGMCLVLAALAMAVHFLKMKWTNRAAPSSNSPTSSVSSSSSSSIVPTTAYRSGLLSMAWSSLTRNVWRSVLTIGLLAFASFLIASMSLFQIAPTLQGSGGFELVAESALPIYRDLGATRVREDALSASDFDTLRKVSILSFRERPGEDASCNNLFQVAQPTVLGVPAALQEHQSGVDESQRFQWAAYDKSFDSGWSALSQVASGSDGDPIPVVLDMNTAAWSLHQGASIGAISKIQFEDRVIYFKTVGLLSNSIMQGKLLISERNFSQVFPEISGYRYFLIHDEDRPSSEVAGAMENGWSDQGLDVTSSAETLSKLLAVQNTYISAFQAIGALGLLLGTIGLAVVQVRSVLERRRELALMQAVGFSRSRISRLLLSEASLLLFGGLAIGVTAALIAVVPYAITGNAQTGIAEPFVMLAIVLIVGWIASLLAVIIALRQPLLENLQ